MNELLSALELEDRDGAPVELMSADRKRRVQRALGFLGTSAVRADVQPLPTGHGARNRSRFTDGQLMVVEGLIVSTVSEEDAFSEFRQLTRPMLETLDIAAALIKWREGATQQRTNLWPDPRFAGGIDPWQISTTCTLAHVGDALEITPDSGVTEGRARTTNADSPQVEEGETYALTFAMANPGDVADRQARASIDWIDAANASVGISTGSLATLPTDGSTVRPSLVATAPAGAVRARLRAGAHTSSGTFSGSETYLVDELLWEQATVAGDYFDGSSDGAEWTGNIDDSTSVYAPGKQRLVKLAAEVEPPLEIGPSVLRYQAQFLADDPRAYSQVLQTIESTALSAAAGGKTYPRTYPRTYTGSGGGEATFRNVGNRPTPLIFRIHGRCVNPQILLVDTGERIVLSGTVPAGQYLELDARERTVRMGGTVNHRGFVRAAETTWMDAPVGESNWRLLAESFDSTARLDLLGRSAYA